MELNPFQIELLKLLSEGYTQTELEGKTKKTKSVIETTLKKARDKNGIKTNIELVYKSAKKNIV